MHFTQTFAAAGMIGLGLSAVVSMVLPEPTPPPPMVINSLSYSDGVVTQDRTVNGDVKLHFGWDAFVVSAITGQPVPGCEGSGSWDYSPGNRVVHIPLAEWVGNANCALLDGGKYQLVARYKGLAWATDGRSEVFVK